MSVTGDSGSPARRAGRMLAREMGGPRPVPGHQGDLPFLPRLLTVSEVAEALQVSPKTVRRMVAYRRIPCVRFGRALRFFPGDVLAWLSARKEG